MSYACQREYIGHMDQLFSLRDYTLNGGKQQGVRAVELHNGADLDIIVLPDRCMDFYQLRYKGKSLNYIGPAGIVAPGLCLEDGRAFLNGFFCGFLTTCGLSNIGNPCEEDGQKFGLHGKISAAPAEQVGARVEIAGGVPTAVIQGTMREGALFGPNLSLKRTIVCKYGENAFTFTDEAVNEGYNTMPFMLLYHFNLGYPLLSEHAALHIPSSRVEPRTPLAREHLAGWREITPPSAPYEEMCYFHHGMDRDADGRVTVGVTNPSSGMAVRITYDGGALDHFVQWKMLGKGEYTMGFEPCNATIEGRPTARADGSLKFLEPGQRMSYSFTVAVSDQ